MLGELCALTAETPEADKATDVAGRKRENPLRTAVVGEAERGKSTLINALLGREVLPSGVNPLTALATVLTCGRPERGETVGPPGTVGTHPITALEQLITETGNPGNRLGQTQVTILLDTPILAGGIDLIDTPGTGSVHMHNTAAAEAVLETMDAAVFVLAAAMRAHLPGVGQAPD